MRKILIVIWALFLFSPKAVFAQYDDYIWNPSEPAQINSQNVPIRDELIEEVQNIVDAGHLAPALIDSGDRTGPGIYFWASPAEIILTLSRAYPYLPSNLQAQVKTYLDNEIANYPLHQYGIFPPTCCGHTLSQQPGARREWFPVQLNRNMNIWPGINPSIESLYPVWLYSYTTGDWNYVTNNWDSLTTIYNNFKNQGTIDSYLQIAGIVGYARMAKQLNKTQEETDAASLASTGFFKGLDFAQFLAAAKTRIPTTYTTPIFLYGNDKSASAGVYAGYFPQEIGRFLHDNALTQVQNYSLKIEREVPLWYLTMPGWSVFIYDDVKDIPNFDYNAYTAENAYLTPEIAWTIFMLHAYILKDDIDTLKGYLDFPSRKADLFHIQKLVATIEASPGVPFGDVDRDGDVDKDDAWMVLSNFGNDPANVTGYYDPVGDNKINGLDFGHVIKDWGL